MVILVTGGCGFIGSNFLVRYVPRHPEIKFVNLDALTYAGVPESVATISESPNYVFEQCDLRHSNAVNRVWQTHEPNAVIHFAAETHVDRSIRRPMEAVETNVIGTLHVLEAARAAWKTGSERFVHISTDEVYGSVKDDESTTEDSAYHPSSPYSAGKAASDHLVRAWAKTFRLPINITHCSNNFGPRQLPEKLIPRMIARLQAGESLPVYGQGLNRRDWLFVDDHNDAIWTVLHKGEVGETYDIGADHEVANIDLVRELIRVVADETGRDANALEQQIEFVEDRPGHDWRYAIDCTKIKRELGWAPAVSFHDGLRNTVRWYLSNPEWLAAARRQLEAVHA
ncbi:MAG: dTDP-glucose 4,6-dehydratase [Fimbriimonadaceae bacterium]|nr:dTDP-glucose 4,6-dehydratase [Fimbriimonadaceae bacterium]